MRQWKNFFHVWSFSDVFLKRLMRKVLVSLFLNRKHLMHNERQQLLQQGVKRTEFLKKLFAFDERQVIQKCSIHYQTTEKRNVATPSDIIMCMMNWYANTCVRGCERRNCLHYVTWNFYSMPRSSWAASSALKLKSFPRLFYHPRGEMFGESLCVCER